MSTIKNLVLFLQNNCKEEALIYAEYYNTTLDKKLYAINSTKRLDNGEVVLFFCQNYKPTIPSIKVKDAIMMLQDYNENDYIFFYHNETKYYVLPNFINNHNDDNYVYLFIDSN